MDKELVSDLVEGMNSLFTEYYKNSNEVIVEDIDTYTELYNNVYSKSIYINRLPYPIRHAENIDVYTLECKDSGIRYIPGMLVGEINKVSMTSVVLGNEFTDGILGLTIEKILGREYDIANALLRSMQTISKLNGEFKTFEFKTDTTKYNHTGSRSRRRLR